MDFPFPPVSVNTYHYPTRLHTRRRCGAKRLTASILCGSILLIWVINRSWQPSHQFDGIPYLSGEVKEYVTVAPVSLLHGKVH